VHNKSSLAMGGHRRCAIDVMSTRKSQQTHVPLLNEARYFPTMP